MEVLNTMKPGLLSPWRLRNDTRYVLAYKCLSTEISFRALTALEAFIAPFLNFEMSFNDIKSLWNKTVTSFKGNKQKAYNFEEVFKKLTRTTDFIDNNGCLSPSLNGNRGSLIPDFAAYEIPKERLNRPLAVNISFTENCRANCLYCYAERASQPDMELGKIRELLDEIAGNDIYIVDITGGDLLTRSDAYDILKAMVEKNFVFFLSTKCYISKKLAKGLAELGIGKSDSPPHLKRNIQLSVDSADSQIAAYLVQRPNYLGRMTESVKNLVEAGISPKIKCVLSEINSQAPRQLVKYFTGLGVKDFQFVQYGRSYYRHKDELFLSQKSKERLPEEIESIRNEYPDIEIVYQNNPSVESKIDTDWDEWNNRSVCSGGRVTMLVKSNGDVTLCDQIPHIPEHVVGNVFKQGVLDVWNSQRLLDFIHPPRERFKNTVCFDCPHFDSCQTGKGYCYRDSLFVYGSLYDAPPNCPRQKKRPPRQI